MRITREQYEEMLRRNPKLRPDARSNGRASIPPNCSTHSRTIAELKSSPGNEPLATKQVQKRDSKRVLISIVSHRKRLLDTDNLFGKWHVDCLRYCGVISGDEPEKATIQTTQVKVSKTEQEFTEITIEEL